MIFHSENCGLYDGLNPHNFKPQSKLDFPDEMRESWLREYLEYRFILSGREATVTDFDVKYLHTKVKMLAIVSI